MTLQDSFHHFARELMHRQLRTFRRFRVVTPANDPSGQGRALPLDEKGQLS